MSTPNHVIAAPDLNSLPAEIICAEVRQACRCWLGLDLRAVVLTGSLARGEGSFIRNDDRWELLGDVDVMAVLKSRTGTARISAETLSKKVEHALAAKNITAKVDISLVSPRYLRSLKPHIFAYELRECGRVLDGDADVLKLIPPFTAAEIPLHDGFRVLANRICEQLDALSECDFLEVLSPQAQYLVTKFYLEMATSLLIFTGHYAPGYRARLEQLEALGSNVTKLPIDLPQFVARVRKCTELKLRPSNACLPFSFWLDAMIDAHTLWNWELLQLKENQRGFARIVRGDGVGCESFSQWARGWAHILRHAGWHRSWRSWPRWLRLCCQGSPRYLVYSAAAQVYFSIASTHSNEEKSLISAHRLLPIVPKQFADGTDWRSVARSISLNYRELLVPTRS